MVQGGVFGIFLFVASQVYFVEVFPALLAEILVWGALGTKNADTSTVLPDLADITRSEERRVGKECRN